MSEPLRCAECGRRPAPGEHGEDEWRVYIDLEDEPHVFCPECAEREFGKGHEC
jgi:DNA-directed RNA polymerase subunit RPC12/RpoP